LADGDNTNLGELLLGDETNILDIFRRRLGVDNLAFLRDDTPLREKAYKEVERAYVDWHAPLAPPAKEPGELRPVFAPSALSPTYEVAETLQSLLVAHSVAIIVPNSINYIARLAWMLTMLEEAIDAGLVHVLSEPTVGRSPEFFGQWVSENQPRAGASLDTEAARETAAARFLETGDIALALDACANFPDRFDLACRTESQRAWLRQRIAQVPGQVTATGDRLAYLSDFLSLRVPAVNATTHDLLALRREGVFDRWRATLADTVREVVAIDDDEFLNPQAARIALLRERMESAVEEITRETTSLPLRIAGESATFSLAIASGAVGAVAGGPVRGAAVGGAAYISAKIIDWLREGPTANDERVRRLVSQVFVDPGLQIP
jgi:hypothetical protein